MTQGRENKVEKFHLVGRIRGPRAQERRFIGGGRAKNSRISPFSCVHPAPSRETNERTRDFGEERRKV